ncbi:MAG: FtsX-like permease family protein [Alphaproteobacteria bacterium]|nr:FtsX-like permease family protein [Alphaproteobacteria bacterium]
MNALTLASASVKSRPLHATLCVLAAGAGIALLCAIFLLSGAVERSFIRNAQGIDVVVGAKGSPLQLVLSTVYAADVPNGNIEADQAKRIEHDPRVAKAIPLALGDNHNGYRIVGTTPDYLSLYDASFAQGKVFEKPFDAVAGALTHLKTGDSFLGAHGLAADSDDIHHYHAYTITGVLKPTGTVLDRLILTQVESVQQLHAHPDLGDPDAAEDLKISHEVTALLLKMKSPLSIMSMPRQLNKTSNMLAANPGYEMARFSRSMGFGKEVLTALGAGFVALSALMLLSALASSLAARRYDLGVLRVLGASPFTLSCTVIAEGMMLSLAGAVFGILAGHGMAYLVAVNIDSLQGLVLPQSFLHFGALDGALLGMGAVTGLVAGLVPAVSAARTDIAGILARGRA